MPGSAGHAERFPGGLGLVVLVNGDVDLTPLVERLRARLDRVAAWPEEDLFERY